MHKKVRVTAKAQAKAKEDQSERVDHMPTLNDALHAYLIRSILLLFFNHALLLTCFNLFSCYFFLSCFFGLVLVHVANFLSRQFLC